MNGNEGVVRTNWFGDIRHHPRVVLRPRSVKEIVAVMRDPARFPAPVRAAGSSHSTTRCVVADGGTVIEMKAMSRILSIGPDSVTAEAGALYIDVARELQRHGLQFYVNIELGNLTMGSAACTHTKDSSFPGEYGQVCSYAIGMKVVTPGGELLEVTEEQPELLQALRTSFGLLGVVYEVTFRVKPLRPMQVHHERLRIEEVEQRLPELKQRGDALMYYLFPFQDAIVFEFRCYVDGGAPRAGATWRIRNAMWKTIVPAVTGTVRQRVPLRAARHLVYQKMGWVTQLLLPALRAPDTFPADQMIRYPDMSGASRYTFSIWAFPEEQFARVVRAYFEFCRLHYRTHGYRCDMLNVGYRINQDRSSLFSYTYDGTAMTVDPVSTAGPGWPEFLNVYNEFCSRNDGSPLFNQTAGLTPAQVATAFGARIEQFNKLQREFDPIGRCVNAYFAELLGLSAGRAAALNQSLHQYSVGAVAAPAGGGSAGKG